MDWVIAATQVRSFHFVGCLGHDPRKYKAVQGMFSGTRATDVYNTILNRAYFGVAVKVLKAQFGISPDDVYNVHQGDDIHMACRNVDATVGVWLTLRLMGLDMRRHKQMLGPGCAEFFRIMFMDDRGFGIPARALINLVLKPLQSSDGDNPLETIPAVYYTIEVLRRRGMSLIASEVIYEDQLRLCSRISLKARDYGAPTVPRALIFGDRMCGRVGLAPPGYWPLKLPTNYVLPHLDEVVPDEVFQRTALPSSEGLGTESFFSRDTLHSFI